MKIILLYNHEAGTEEFPLSKISNSFEEQCASVLGSNFHKENYGHMLKLCDELILVGGGGDTAEKTLLRLSGKKYLNRFRSFLNTKNIVCHLGSYRLLCENRS